MIRLNLPESKTTVEASDEFVYLAYRDSEPQIVPMKGLRQRQAFVREMPLDAIAVFHDSRPISEIRPLVQRVEAKLFGEVSQAELFTRTGGTGDQVAWQEEPSSRATKALEGLRAFSTKPIGEFELSADEVLIVRGQLLTQWLEADQAAKPGSLADWLEGNGDAGDLARQSALERLMREQQNILETVPMLNATKLARLRGSRAHTHRALAKRLRDSGELLGVKVGREFLYPEFQFDPRSGQLRAQMAEILVLLRCGEADTDGWRAMHWFYARTGTLSGERPYEVFTINPDRVLLAAREEFSDADPVSESAAG